MNPASPARTIRPQEHTPPLDLATYRERNAKIVKEREKARRDFEEIGIEAADFEHEYRKRKAIRLAHHRHDNKGVTEAETLAEGDVAEWRRERDTAQILAKAAYMRWQELERNAASLRKEADFGELVA